MTRKPGLKWRTCLISTCPRRKMTGEDFSSSFCCRYYYWVEEAGFFSVNHGKMINRWLKKSHRFPGLLQEIQSVQRMLTKKNLKQLLFLKFLKAGMQTC